MADVFPVSKRSEIMKSVKSDGNKSTEQKLIQYFKDNHISGWRRNYNVKGHPDPMSVTLGHLALKRFNTLLF